ncbi:MAG TPA: MBL fold metallo-hydrolase, partial [Chitinophagaceae bacterium]
HLLLSHLSKENNSPEIVEQLFNAHANGIKIVVASRYKETEVYCIENIQHKIPSAIKQLSVQQLQLAF